MPAGELARRWTVAAVGVPAVVGVLYAGGWALGAAVGVFAAIGADETFRLAGARGVRPLRGLGIAGATALPLLAVAAPSLHTFGAWTLGAVAALLLLTLVGVTFWRGPEGHPLAAASATLFGVCYVGLPLAVVVLLHRMPGVFGWTDGSRWAAVAMVALPLTATWVGDATAFFAGTAWGRRRLAPSISPKKSWEGAMAGVSGAAIGAVLWFLVVRGVLPGAPVGIASAAAIGALLGVAAILGDLVESVLKRDAGVKDSGTLLPGHGGVLDRIDALVFSLPVAFALLLALEAAS